MHAALYRAGLPDLDGVPSATAEAVRQSLATATAKLDGSLPELLGAAQHAFTVGMQVTSVIAALLLSVSAVIAWRVIPSERYATVAPAPEKTVNLVR